MNAEFFDGLSAENATLASDFEKLSTGKQQTFCRQCGITFTIGKGHDDHACSKKCRDEIDKRCRHW